MNNVDELLAAARSDSAITYLAGARARGAEEYLGALARVSEATDLTGQELRDMAGACLIRDASGPAGEAKEYACGAGIAYRVIRDLQENQ